MHDKDRNHCTCLLQTCEDVTGLWFGDWRARDIGHDLPQATHPQPTSSPITKHIINVYARSRKRLPETEEDGANAELKRARKDQRKASSGAAGGITFPGRGCAQAQQGAAYAALGSIQAIRARSKSNQASCTVKERWRKNHANKGNFDKVNKRLEEQVASLKEDNAGLLQEVELFQALLGNGVLLAAYRKQLVQIKILEAELEAKRGPNDADHRHEVASVREDCAIKVWELEASKEGRRRGGS
ncbi:hypothetical protein VYU27_003826 [Nannochloropsis oceanica]